jgi:YD repeat-containing protein
MNKKYQKYINYIVSDIKPPYFINMEDHYGLKDNEYPLVLSKVYNQPVSIEDNHRVYDTNGNILYYEYSDGSWEKREYNSNDNLIYYEDGNGNWYKREYDTNNNEIHYEDGNGYWYKYGYDANGNKIYHEDSTGVWIDKR